MTTYIGTVADVMTTDLVTVDAQAPAADAARLMRDNDTGNVLVTNAGQLVGIVTDRDLVVRLLAEDGDGGTPVRDAVSGELITVEPSTTASEAVRLMREHAVRRLPVVEGDRPVGIVSIGDMAMEHDETSALADISAAPADS